MSKSVLDLLSLPDDDRIIGIGNAKTLFLAPDANDRAIYFHRIAQARLCGSNLHYPNVLVYSAADDQFYQAIKERTLSLEKLGSVTATAPEVTAANKTCDTPLFFFIYNTDNYYHFIYDSLPYLISYRELRKTVPDLKLLVNYPNSQNRAFYPFVVEFLALLGIGAEDLVVADPHTEYRQLFISTSYTHGHNSLLPPRAEIYDFYRDLVDTVRPQFRNDTPRKIYVSRRSWLHNNFQNIGTNYTTRRRLENEDELVSYLTAQGFSEVFTENLSTFEKLNLFANADCVVGAIGGGACNVLFSPPDTRLICLLSPTFLDVNPRFVYSLDHVQLTMFEAAHHTEPGPFKRYMRVHCPAQGIIGEISAINGDALDVAFTRENIAGWNAQNAFQTITLNAADCVPLDAGLNSPWSLDFDAFLRQTASSL